MMILDDQHASIIYGYEKKNDVIRFLVHDVGYQKDTYLNSKTWQPYKEKMGTQIKSINGSTKSFGRTATKLLYLN